ncbi:hypothetical protein MNV49_005669 [Pseudohyphozyma bogoriensis]|nr:hypothetical protein MNV49_005669 [Pseudohyphozyma bogoriensis]
MKPSSAHYCLATALALVWLVGIVRGQTDVGASCTQNSDCQSNICTLTGSGETSSSSNSTSPPSAQSGTCAKSPGACLVDDDCSSSQYCKGSSPNVGFYGTCETLPTDGSYCRTDADCPNIGAQYDPTCIEGNTCSFPPNDLSCTQNGCSLSYDIFAARCTTCLGSLTSPYNSQPWTYAQQNLEDLIASFRSNCQSNVCQNPDDGSKISGCADPVVTATGLSLSTSNGVTVVIGTAGDVVGTAGNGFGITTDAQGNTVVVLSNTGSSSATSPPPSGTGASRSIATGFATTTGAVQTAAGVKIRAGNV